MMKKLAKYLDGILANFRLPKLADGTNKFWRLIKIFGTHLKDGNMLLKESNFERRRGWHPPLGTQKWKGQFKVGKKAKNAMQNDAMEEENPITFGEILLYNEWKNDIFIFGCDVNSQNHRILRGQWNYSSYHLTQNAVT
jgi:hypothetical protein